MNLVKNRKQLKVFLQIVILIFVSFIFYYVSINNYLLFHSLAEMFSITIAFTMYFITWNSREFNKNTFLKILGCAFFFIGSLDLIHMLAYKGMNIFGGYDADLPTQLWIIARYLQSFSFVAAAFLIGRKFKTEIVITLYSIFFFVFVYLVFSRLFPHCFIEGKGLTEFKKISEYIISAILLFSLILLYKKRKNFEKKILLLIYLSIISTIISEILFTFYISVYGISNYIGHIFKIIAFYLIYRALITSGLKRPYSLMFRDLKINEERYKIAQTIGKVGNWEYNIETEMFWGSDEAKEIYGFDPEAKDFTKDEVESCIPDRENVHQALIDLIEYNKPYDIEFEIIAKDKSESKLIHSIAILKKDAEGVPLKVSGVIHDITDRKKAEQKIKESEEKYSKLIETTSEGFWLLDSKKKTVNVNQSLCDMLAYSRKEMIGKTPMEFTDEESKKIFEEQSSKITSTLHRSYEIFLRRKDGINIPAIINATTLIDGDGKCFGSFAFVTDITERKRAEEIQKTLFEISNALNTVDNLKELFINIREQMGKIIDTKNFFIALYDEKTDMVSLPFHLDEKDEYETFPAGKTLTKYVIDTGKPLFATNEVVDELTEKGIVEIIGTPSEIWIGVPLKIENKIIGVCSVQSYDDPNLYTEKDIEILTFASEEIALAINHQQADEQIATDLKEKTVLLQEIYHRTKNNMQVIISMLKMQSRRSDNEYENSSFMEITNKIQAMSLVHQKLYEAKDLSRINLKDYIDDLLHLISVSYSLQADNVSLKLELDDVYVLIDSAVPLGLVLNELISNIFKHAFPNKGTGEISIRMNQEDNGTINIYIADDGIGIPVDMDMTEINSMGLQTVFSLIKYQLQGSYRYDTDNGLKWHIKFRDDINKVRV